MKIFSAIIFSALSVAGCQAHTSSANSISGTTIPPPPQPSNQDELHASALARGAGDCSDLGRIKAYPTQAGLLGEDPFYDRILVHIEKYRSCLILAISDQTPVHGISFGPGIIPGTVGDLAYALLVDGGQVQWGICVPDQVAHSTSGAATFYSWLSKPANRTDWQVCVLRELAPNNSFQGNTAASGRGVP